MKLLLWICIFAFLYDIASGGHFIWIGINIIMLIFTINLLIHWDENNKEQENKEAEDKEN